jgi:hypothetical protein
MMEKVHKHCDSMMASVSKKQGGGNRNSGPKSAKNVKTGESISSPLTTQDQARKQGGGPKNPYHEV